MLNVQEFVELSREKHGNKNLKYKKHLNISFVRNPKLNKGGML